MESKRSTSQATDLSKEVREHAHKAGQVHGVFGNHRSLLVQQLAKKSEMHKNVYNPLIQCN